MDDLSVTKDQIDLVVPSTPLGVRNALETLKSQVQSHWVSEDAWSTVEIVLAEVLNNIVEHAYEEKPGSKIDIELTRDEATLSFYTMDSGNKLPGLALPEGKAHELSADVQDLPEGGFGWFLIKELTQELEYQRIDGKNELRFRIDCATG